MHTDSYTKVYHLYFANMTVPVPVTLGYNGEPAEEFTEGIEGQSYIEDFGTLSGSWDAYKRARLSMDVALATQNGVFTAQQNLRGAIIHTTASGHLIDLTNLVAIVST